MSCQFYLTVCSMTKAPIESVTLNPTFVEEICAIVVCLRDYCSSFLSNLFWSTEPSFQSLMLLFIDVRAIFCIFNSFLGRRSFALFSFARRNGGCAHLNSALIHAAYLERILLELSFIHSRWSLTHRVLFPRTHLAVRKCKAIHYLFSLILLLREFWVAGSPWPFLCIGLLL